MDALIIFLQTHWISIIGTIIGLVYLYLEYKANILMWAASIVMALFYVYIFYHTKLYASMGIYTYFFFASIYGWIMWYRKKNENEEYTILRMNGRYKLPIVAACILTAIIIYAILIQFSDNQTYITIGDALTTAFNIVALWMASRRWAEQWLLLIPANAISAGLLFAQDDSVAACLFIIYFIVSILGYQRWKRIAIA